MLQYLILIMFEWSVLTMHLFITLHTYYMTDLITVMGSSKSDTTTNYAFSDIIPINFYTNDSQYIGCYIYIYIYKYK